MEIWYTEFGIELRSEADKLRDKYRGRIRLVMKYIRQYDEMTCGVTCIANILIHYGVNCNRKAENNCNFTYCTKI